MERSFSGGAALRAFLLELFGNERPTFEAVEDYVRKVRDTFRSLLGGAGVFVDTFTLEASSNHVYSLFFFTSNALGFEKMLATKWELDGESGHGFKLSAQPSLFEKTEVDNYADRLLDFLRSGGGRSNEEVYLFGLQNGYLPTHTKKTLDRAKANGVRIELISLDGQPARGYYLKYKPDRRVSIRINR